MVIDDKIYGKTDIVEPVLLELLACPSVQRLKNITQFGIPEKYYCFNSFSRYDHCVGVMILLGKLGCSIEEQIAGLLHDVSVLAFSHIADWVFGDARNGVEDYHDIIHNVFVSNSEIPAILSRHGFEIERILNDGNFPLLEKSSPDLCADRVDYALREFEVWSNPSIVSRCVDSLISFENEMVFDSSEVALVFASNFLQLQAQHWGAEDPIRRYHSFSNMLKYTIDKGITSENDFFKDEKYILDKLEKSEDKFIKEVLSILQSKKKLTKKSGQKVIKKFRHVDPKVLVNGVLKRLTGINSEFENILEEHRVTNLKGIIV